MRARLDHVASLIVNVNHCIMGMAEKREMVRRGTGQAGDLTFFAATSRRLKLLQRSVKCGCEESPAAFARGYGAPRKTKEEVGKLCAPFFLPEVSSR